MMKDQLLDLPRDALLRVLARGITELTVRNRAHYADPDARGRLIEGNEAMHWLNGHLRDLLDPAEPMTESRADGMLEALALLTPRTREHLLQGAA